MPNALQAHSSSAMPSVTRPSLDPHQSGQDCELQRARLSARLCLNLQARSLPLLFHPPMSSVTFLSFLETSILNLLHSRSSSIGLLFTFTLCDYSVHSFLRKLDLRDSLIFSTRHHSCDRLSTLVYHSPKLRLACNRDASNNLETCVVKNRSGKKHHDITQSYCASLAG